MLFFFNKPGDYKIFEFDGAFQRIIFSEFSEQTSLRLRIKMSENKNKRQSCATLDLMRRVFAQRIKK